MNDRRTWTTDRKPGHRFLVTTVRVAGRLAKAADRFLKPYHLTMAQFNLLVVLTENQEGCSQTRIGDELVVSRADITGLVRRMRQRGLCRTSADPSDARVKRVQITPAGQRLTRLIRGPYFAEIARLTGSLDEAEMIRVADTLDRLEENLSRP